jgi:hypothetical protein
MQMCALTWSLNSEELTVSRYLLRLSGFVPAPEEDRAPLRIED